jgi:hypothetical protein
MKKIVYSILAFSPMLAFAQNTGYFNNIITFFANAVRGLIPIFFGLAVLYFFYGIGKFILSADDGKKREEGKNVIIWGVIALAVMSSVWGITAYLKDIIGIQNAPAAPNNVTLPTVN